MQENKQWKCDKEEKIEQIKIKISDDLVQECQKLAANKKKYLVIRGLFSTSNELPDELCQGVGDVHNTLMVGYTSKENFGWVDNRDELKYIELNKLGLSF